MIHSVGLVWTTAVQPRPTFAELDAAPAWVPADRETRLGLGLLFVVALPLTAAWRAGGRRAIIE